MGSENPGSAFRLGGWGFSHMDRLVVAGPNVVEQAGRHGVGREVLREFFRRMIRHHWDQGPGCTERSGSYLYYSKSLNFAVVTDFLEDHLGGHRGMHFAVEAVLPRWDGQGQVAEKYRIIPFWFDLDEVVGCAYLSWIMQQCGGDGIVESERIYDYNTKSVAVDGCEIKIILCNNRYLDLFERSLMVMD